MKNKVFKNAKVVLISLLALLLLVGCGNSYTESDIEDAKHQAYNEGYDNGYEDGYYRGSKEQWEKDCEELLIDGRSIRTIEELVYDEYGLTPSEAFTVVDEYEYDSTHGGYTKAEYKNAIEAIYYTASIFPYDY